MNFVTELLISTNLKINSFDSIFFINYHLIKIIHYQPVKVTINMVGLTKMIIDIVMRYYSLPALIIND